MEAEHEDKTALRLLIHSLSSVASAYSIAAILLGDLKLQDVDIETQFALHAYIVGLQSSYAQLHKYMHQHEMFNGTSCDMFVQSILSIMGTAPGFVAEPDMEASLRKIYGGITHG